MSHPMQPPFEVAGSMVHAPLDQSLIDMLQNSPLEPILNTPVSEVLHKMGLGPLPQLPMPALPPMPGLPPFPAINVENLFKPLTDLAQSFGSGDLGESGFDPSMLFSGLSQLMQTTVSSSSGALKALDGVWQGMASSANATKGATAATEGVAVGAKSGDIAANTQTGAYVVGTGNLTLQGVLAKFMASASVAMATFWTGAGAMALFAAAALALDEALMVVTGTKSALAPETVKQLSSATQIPITGAPATTSPFGVASTVLEAVGTPITSFAGQGTSMLGSMTKQMASAHKSLNDKDKDKDAGKLGGAAGLGGAVGKAAKSGGGAGGGKLGGGGAGGGGGVGVPATPLQPRAGAPGLPGAATESAAASTSPTSTRVAATTTTGSGGMMPMGAGAAGGARGAGTDDGHGSPDFLVTADHGSEVVGSLPNSAPPVIGDETEHSTEASPDVELRL